MSNQDPAAIFHGSAEIIALRFPEVIAGLLDRHHAGPDGRCVGCWSPVHPTPADPCPLRALAETARALRQRAAR